MIKKLGNAMKNMAQRSMWRGNRDDAMAIEQHGIHGMRSNLQDKNESNTGATKAPILQNNHSTIQAKGVSEKEDAKKDLGNSILGALNPDGN